MDAANLLNLDVDTLFEQHNVPEIDVVHKKIQSVVENKREELRLMVGERYRDLLQAADTIGAMKDSSAKLIVQVESISTNCRKLNEQQLLGFKTTAPDDLLKNRNAHKQLNNYFSTMVQIKLLTALPELIWTQIDDGRFYTASELFIFSRHISTGLQLDSNNSLMQHLPVAKKQWETLKPFNTTIKQHVLLAMELEDLSVDVALDCLLSLLLLEKNNINSIFKTFLNLRCNTFLSCLNEDKSFANGERRRVKDRILASLRILNSTIDLMIKCFMENGLLYQKLSEINNPIAPPTITLMHRIDAQFSYLLPEIISNFRPKIDTQPINETQLRAMIEQWLADTLRIADIELKKLFDFVSSMSTIKELKTEANTYRKHLNFDKIITILQLSQTLDFYELKYVPLINQRIHNIIHDSWAKAIQTTFEALESAMSDAAANPLNIWLEQATDLPVSLAVALSEDSKVKKLLMKTRGYDAKIIALCAEFDSQLEGIVSEMNVLLEEQATRAEDKIALIIFLRETAEAQLTHFLSRAKSLHLEPTQRPELLFVARCCVALVELSPNLKVCFCQRSGWRQWVGNVAANSVAHWNRVCMLLEEEAFHFWEKIVRGILEEYRCEKMLPNAITHKNILEEFANWETVKLEQKDEEEATIHSTLRIPNQPRISLQTYLFTLIGVLNTIVPQTLPSKVLHYFNLELLTQILQHYQHLTNDKQSINQNIALQLYFDLKFLQCIFGIAREERVLNEQFASLQNSLKEIIDPFDFELFAEHMTTNVKRCVKRFNCEFGVLTPPLSAHMTTVTPVMSVHEKDPNVLSLSSSGSTSLWFPLLPIISTASTSNAERKSNTVQDIEKDTTTRKATGSTTTSPAAGGKSKTESKSKSGAASFFGAMSQDWFR
ncbi:conserved oligomeric Golgi complex subunit 1 [Eurosta solidaginis]|uniref:conserved oligomeric Golgi complex subunit 1 n=1 Tax=Eurosta solidaginis TaxID=178769 RepID=UPI003530B829